MRRAPLLVRFLALCSCLLILGGCVTAVPPTRTLPSYVKRVYIAEFRNKSREFGAQGPLTLKVHDAFLADGRIDVVQNERADLRLEGTITRFVTDTAARQGDRFPFVTRIDMTCTVDLWDPYDQDRVAPVFRFEVPAQVQYISDPRRSIAETRTEALNRLYESMATNIVTNVLYGASRPPTPVEGAAVQAYQERRGPGVYEPQPTAGRLPDPNDPGMRVR